MRGTVQVARRLQRALLCGSILVSTLSVASPAAQSTDDGLEGAVWTVELPAEIQWHRSTLFDVPLIQTERGLRGINGSTGETLWEISGLVVERDDVSEFVDLLLINARDGTADNGQARALAVEVLTGAVRWENRDIAGRTLITLPLLDEGQLLLVNSERVSTSNVAGAARSLGRRFGFGGGGDDDGLNEKPWLALADLASGTVRWNEEYREDVRFIKSASTLGSTQFTLAGLSQPGVDEGDLYVPWSGFARYDLQTGRPDWFVEYDTLDDDLFGAGTYVIQDGVAYTSEKGEVRAIDLADGDVKWRARGLGDVVPQLFVEGDRVYAKLGGMLFHSGNGQYEAVGDRGFAAFNAANGRRLWKYDDVVHQTTNAIAWNDGFLFADHSYVYGISRDGEELLRQPIDFNEDFPPYLCQLRDGLLEIRSVQQRALFNIEDGSELYNLEFEPPGSGEMSGWQRFTVTGTAMAGRMVGGMLLGSGSITTRVAGLATIMGTDMMAARMTERWTRADQYDFFLTAAENDRGSTNIVRVDRATGSTETIVAYGDEDVSPELDRVYGRAYTAVDRTLYAHDLVEEAS